jgi:hypothetical protein
MNLAAESRYQPEKAVYATINMVFLSGSPATPVTMKSNKTWTTA